MTGDDGEIGGGLEAGGEAGNIGGGGMMRLCVTGTLKSL